MFTEVSKLPNRLIAIKITLKVFSIIILTTVIVNGFSHFSQNNILNRPWTVWVGLEGTYLNILHDTMLVMTLIWLHFVIKQMSLWMNIALLANNSPWVNLRLSWYWNSNPRPCPLWPDTFPIAPSRLNCSRPTKNDLQESRALGVSKTIVALRFPTDWCSALLVD